MIDSDLAVGVQGLRKSYGSVDAVAGVDFAVHRGEIFGLLGPNGAGKTTTVEILEGHRRRDGGDVRVLGADPADADRGWRERVGMVLQDTQIEPALTVEESLQLFAGYYRAPRSVAEVLALVGLEDERGRRAGTLSGGQQRRLDVGIGLVGDPELLFLDEPTTGFDPSARHQFWDVIATLRTLGTTIILTTHYMDEAQALADRVAVVAHGRVLADGPVAQLGGRSASEARITFTLPPTVAAADLPAPSGSRLVGAAGGHAELRTSTPVQTLGDLTQWCLARGLELPDLEVRRPTLEEVYLDIIRGEATS